MRRSGGCLAPLHLSLASLLCARPGVWHCYHSHANMCINICPCIPACRWLARATEIAHGWGLFNLGSTLQLAEVRLPCVTWYCHWNC